MMTPNKTIPELILLLGKEDQEWNSDISLQVKKIVTRLEALIESPPLFKPYELFSSLEEIKNRQIILDLIDILPNIFELKYKPENFNLDSHYLIEKIHAHLCLAYCKYCQHNSELELTKHHYLKFIKKEFLLRLGYCSEVITSDFSIKRDLIQYIILVYSRKNNIPIFPFSALNLGKKELTIPNPNVAYSFNTDKNLPDLAVEISFNPKAVEDISNYLNLLIPEVWIWYDRQIKFFTLQQEKESYPKYVEIKKSKSLTGLASDGITTIVNSCFGKSLLEIEKYF